MLEETIISFAVMLCSYAKSEVKMITLKLTLDENWKKLKLITDALVGLWTFKNILCL